MTNASKESIRRRKLMVAKLGQDKPVTFESLKRFKQPDGRVNHAR
jgi:hypothetical protein